ncbi:hypothetical protein [Sinomonas terrae]|uniref:Uncharacterized protein n=1 Tax=Sinomonas terrae TaxID=2908838 RepID=A0ABS9U620_9MICC|nr:hypothetical protein [Sinomonas terrae]MCH6472133.1 hypothetical protein [Sinomonas terrae]
MMEQREFEARAVRNGHLWEIAIPELGQTAATNDAERVELYARKLAAASLGVPPRAVAMRVTFEEPLAAL